MNQKKVFLYFCVFSIFISCSNKTKTIETDSKILEITEISQGQIEEDEPVYIYQRKNYKSLENQYPSAHEQYLNDEMVFNIIPTQNIEHEKTAIVGSDVCMFYTNAQPQKIADLQSLPQGQNIPFGTIIPITGKKLKSEDGENWGTGMFKFEDNWNWFYPTEYKGQKGIVFGSDLAGINDSVENNRITASLYNNEGHPEEFYPILGYKPLSTQIQQKLSQERLAIQAVAKKEFYLSASRPDDMIALYMKHRSSGYFESTSVENKKVPMFITTDLISHSQHLIFDRILQHIEEDYFLPRLLKLCTEFETIIIKDQKNDPEVPEKVAITKEKAVHYFQVAKAILELSPKKIIKKDSWGRTEIHYEPVNEKNILNTYSDLVKQEISLIQKASSFTHSPLFTFSEDSFIEEDYTQYKPRGHYTKNEALSAYFKAMMWFGRIHFLIAQEGLQPWPMDGNQAPKEAGEVSLDMAPIALYITKLVQENQELFAAWENLYDPISTLIGESDDISFNEIKPLFEKFAISNNFDSWITEKETLVSFISAAHEALTPPAISGNSVFWGHSETEERKPPMGWRFLGQRFVWDSWIHHHVSPPRLMSRDMVQGLDIMKVFGSHFADTILKQTDYKTMDGLEEKLNELQEQFSGFDESQWNQTYYSQALYAIKQLCLFEAGSGFYFTEGNGWDLKSLLSSHAAWAELRHDTLLYAKQSYAERAGDGDFEPTFRTKPVPDPIHYIEPNLHFFSTSLNSILTLQNCLKEFDLLDSESEKTLSAFVTMLERIISIVVLETADEPVDSTDIKWIPTIPNELARLVLVHTGRGDNIEEKDLQMALVADVFTNGELGLVLETAVGIPYRIYVPLNDGQGGKRIAVGYCFSYYEFPHRMDNRLNDDEWKKIVYDESLNMKSYEPFWVKNRILPSETTEK